MSPHAFFHLHPGWFFMAGCLLVQQLIELPVFAEYLALAGLCFAAWLITAALFPSHASALLATLVSLLAGVYWAGLQAQSALEQRLPHGLETERLVMTGFIDGLVRRNDDGRSVSFPFRVSACERAASWCPVGSQVLVTIKTDKSDGSTRLRAGSRWNMDLRLKAIHGQRNPGGSDLERFALQSGWVARGSAPASHIVHLDDLASHPLAWVHRVREQLRDALRQSARLSGSKNMDRAMAVIEALVIGSGEALDPEQWDAFNRTGVGHLLSISGSHVTMFAGFAAFFGLGLLRISGAAKLTFFRVHTMALPKLCFASFGAIAYTLLAGFGLPAQRTCAMVLVTGLMSLSGRRFAPQAVLSCAGVVVCLIDPWAVVSAGFWLSFAAVAALVLSGQAMRRPENPTTNELTVPSKAWKSLRAGLAEAFQGQWAASVVMIPLSVLFFSQISWIAPFANALAIPWITFIITPASLLLALIASISQTLASVPLHWLGLITEESLKLLDAMANWSWISSHRALPPEAVIAVAIIACILLIWPLAPWPRWAVVSLMLPLMVWPHDRPGEGELRVLFFDVGQGSAVFVQSAEFSMLYDSGPAWSLDARKDGRNAGFQSILPALRSRGIESIDWLVLSHADLDHTGGALSLQRHLRIGKIMSGSPADEPSLRDLKVSSCQRDIEFNKSVDSTQIVKGRGEAIPTGVSGTSIRALFPLADANQPAFGAPMAIELSKRPRKTPASNRNAQSCVLLIEHKGRSILLPGDLPSLQEAALLLLEPAQPLKSLDVLMLGHHGASNSTSVPWLDYWQPKVAVVQSGYQNRYGHPQMATLNRLCERTISLRRTDTEGAIELHISSEGQMHWQSERSRSKRYWTRMLVAPMPCEGKPIPSITGVESS